MCIRDSRYPASTCPPRRIGNSGWYRPPRQTRPRVPVRNGFPPVSYTHLLKKKMVSERLEQVRDVFIFSCFSGLAYVDVANLKEH